MSSSRLFSSSIWDIITAKEREDEERRDLVIKLNGLSERDFTVCVKKTAFASRSQIAGGFILSATQWRVGTLDCDEGAVATTGQKVLVEFRPGDMQLTPERAARRPQGVQIFHIAANQSTPEGKITELRTHSGSLSFGCGDANANPPEFLAKKASSLGLHHFGWNLKKQAPAANLKPDLNIVPQYRIFTFYAFNLFAFPH